MARAEANKLYRTFVAGLVTEAGPLTYPENASIAEDNCIIYRTGNRSRRLGIDLETYGSSNVVTTPGESIGSKAFKSFRWDSVAEQEQIVFLVEQIGLTLYFFNITFNHILDGGEKGFVVDLTPFVVSGSVSPETCEVQMSSGKGLLFVAGEKFEPIFVRYSPDLDTVAAAKITIQIRDFKGLADGLANDEEPVTLTDSHHYNLRNQGWVDPANNASGSSVTYYDQYGGTGTYNAPPSTPITSYFTSTTRYPGNNKQWWVAKNSTTGAFDPALLTTFFAGSAPSPKGHYVVDAYNVDRTLVSGIAGIPIEITTTRPSSVAFANGRAFFGGHSVVYFSQLLNDKSKVGFCYQEADPTSENISDLIATDGGAIPIPEMAQCVRLVPSGAGIVVFSTNGVWFIGGTQAGFSATDISVSKISPIGTDSPDSIVEVDNSIYWWSKIGIMAMAQKQGMFGTVEGVFDKQNITEKSIQTFYNDIPDASKRYVQAVYDPLTNVIQWLYQDDNNLTSPYFFNRILNLDLTLQAFYPWSISNLTSYPHVVGLFTSPNPAGYNGSANVTVRDTFIKYIVMTQDATVYRVNFAQFSSISFTDWDTWGVARDQPYGVPYESFVETGYEILEDALRKKQTPWVFTYFKRTEENYVPDGPDFTTDRQSSCQFQVKWDWASSQISNKYSTKREAYRHVRLPFFDESNPAFDTGFPIVITKHKVRGSGKAIQFRFDSSEPNKDFDLLGWAVNVTGNTKP